MTTAVYIFSLLGYIALSFFYFVERDFSMAASIWVGLLLLKIGAKPLRGQAPLLFLVGASFGFHHLLAKASPWLQWPLDFYLAALFGFLVLKYVLRKPIEKLKWSLKFSKAELGSIFVINIPAIAVLTWYFKAHPEIANMWPVPSLPVWSIPFVVLGIAAINGLREEIFYRGFLQPASSSEQSPTWFIIGLQAVLFGFLHFMNAFPQGWLGVLLTALWGSAIAIQYRMFKSISLAWITHAMADAIMFSIILYTRA